MTEITLSDIFQMPKSQMGAAASLGMDKVLVAEDSFSLVMKVKAEHLNEHGTVHGGILYTLCDQAVAAHIAYGKRKGVGMDGSIHYYRPALLGDTLTATVSERKAGKKIGVYFVELRDQENKVLADGLFTAMYMDETPEKR